MNYRWYITNGLGEYAFGAYEFNGRIQVVEFRRSPMDADSWEFYDEAEEQLAEWHNAGLIPDGCEVVSGDDL